MIAELRAAVPDGGYPELHAVCGRFLQRQASAGPITLLDADPQRWLACTFAPVLAPAFREMSGLLASRRVEGVVALDRELDGLMPEQAACGSHAAGGLMLRETSVLRGEKWYARLIEKTEGKVHFLTVYAARGSLFFVGLDAAVKGLLCVEGLCGGMRGGGLEGLVDSGMQAWKASGLIDRGLRAA